MDPVKVPFSLVPFLYVTYNYSEKGGNQHVILKVTLYCDMIRHWLLGTVMITDTCNNK